MNWPAGFEKWFADNLNKIKGQYFIEWDAKTRRGQPPAIAKYTASPTSKRNNSKFHLHFPATPAYIVYMTNERYLEAEETGQLTQAEVDEGWHFCEGFDGALTNHIDTECEWCGFVKPTKG